MPSLPVFISKVHIFMYVYLSIYLTAKIPEKYGIQALGCFRTHTEDLMRGFFRNIFQRAQNWREKIAGIPHGKTTFGGKRNSGVCGFLLASPPEKSDDFFMFCHVIKFLFQIYVHYITVTGCMSV